MKSDNKKFITSVILIAGINIAGIIGCWLVFSAVQKERSAVLEARRGIDIGERRLNNVRSLGALLKDIEKDTEKISATFLNSETIVKFIEELESINQKTGTNLLVRVINLPNQSETKAPYFEFQIRGSFRGLFQYLILLENVPYQITIDRVNLTRPTAEELDKNEKIGNWRADFKVTLLSYENI
jgi:hypothetical protein